MGYYIEQIDARFFMRGQYAESAFEALNASLALGVPTASAHWTTAVAIGTRGLEESEHIAELIQKCDGTTFKEAMSRAGWDLEENANHDFVSICRNGDKYYEIEEEVLRAIAPWVATGSFIENRGEDGNQYRLVFVDGRLEEHFAELVWDNDLPAFDPNADLAITIRTVEKLAEGG